MKTPALCAAVLLLLAVSQAAAGETSDGVPNSLEVVELESAAHRKLLRVQANSPYKVTWGKSPKSVRLAPGAYVQINYAKNQGVAYGTSRCSFRQVFAKGANKAGSVLIRLPRGNSSFGDPTNRNCANGFYIDIVAF